MGPLDSHENHQLQDPPAPAPAAPAVVPLAEPMTLEEPLAKNHGNPLQDGLDFFWFGLMFFHCLEYFYAKFRTHVKDDSLNLVVNGFCCTAKNSRIHKKSHNICDLKQA